MSSGLDQHLATHGPTSATWKACTTLLRRRRPEPFGSLAELATARGYADRTDAAARRAASPEVTAALDALLHLDDSDGVGSALRTALSVVTGGGSGAVRERQGRDAVHKAFVLAWVTATLFDGAPPERVAALLSHDSGRALVNLFGIVEVALPFLDERAEGTDLGRLAAQYGPDELERLCARLGPDANERIRAVLPALAPELERSIRDAAADIDAILSAAQALLPGARVAGDAVADALGGGLDLLALYHVLGPRLVAEACLADPDLVPRPAGEWLAEAQADDAEAGAPDASAQEGGPWVAEPAEAGPFAAPRNADPFAAPEAADPFAADFEPKPDPDRIGATIAPPDDLDEDERSDDAPPPPPGPPVDGALAAAPPPPPEPARPPPPPVAEPLRPVAAAEPVAVAEPVAAVEPMAPPKPIAPPVQPKPVPPPEPVPSTRPAPPPPSVAPPKPVVSAKPVAPPPKPVASPQPVAPQPVATVEPRRGRGWVGMAVAAFAVVALVACLGVGGATLAGGGALVWLGLDPPSASPGPSPKPSKPTPRPRPGRPGRR